MAVKILNFEINPKLWAQMWSEALGNTFAGLEDNFKNRRLWIGFGASIILHLLILLFSTEKAVAPEEMEWIGGVTYYDERYHPKAQKVIREQQEFLPGAAVKEVEEAGVISLEKRYTGTQVALPVEGISLEKGSAEVAGIEDIIKINPAYQISTEDILREAPIELTKGTGVGKSKGFLAIPDIGAPIDIAKGRIKAGDLGEVSPIRPIEEVSKKAAKPKVEEEPGEVGFVLTGDLKWEDIVEYRLPRYPTWAKNRYIETSIQIQFSVAKNGKVILPVIVLKGTGYPNWDGEVKEILARWKFKPSEMATRRGIVTFIFRLT